MRKCQLDWNSTEMIDMRSMLIKDESGASAQAFADSPIFKSRISKDFVDGWKRVSEWVRR